MIKWMKLHKQIVLYILGLCIVALSLVPYFVLKENVWVPFHDQLDGEVPNYIYQAKYLFQNTPIYELMNGIPKTGMLAPAPFGVLFFCVLSPFWAYVLLQVLVTVTAYSGMFLLVSKVTEDSGIGFLCGCLFAYLPLMPVYGLSIAGQPILWYAFWNLYEKKNVWLSYILIFVYAGFSSLALVGFAVCLAVLIFLLIFLFQKKLREHLQMPVGFGVMCATYVLCNFSLVFDFLPWSKGAEAVSHRTEFVLAPITDYVAEFKAVFFGEGTYTPAFAGWICGVTIVIIAICIFLRRHEWIKTTVVLVGIQFAITVLALMWDSSICMNILRQSGPLEHFQADRISWLIPPIWYVVLGLDFNVIRKIFAESKIGKKMIRSALGYCIVLVLCGIATWVIYNQSFFYHQLRQVVFPNSYKIMTWSQYYAEDVFEQIDENIGRDKSEYRVVSLGMSPAAALYNGFFCLDGYSNNYLLSYKHTFRKAMDGELAKSEAMRVYFDEWGNRCYLMSSESGSNPMIGKHTATGYQNLEINVSHLLEMGCEYLFSAMEIMNAKENNLKPEGVYETPSSYYKIYVYCLR